MADHSKIEWTETTWNVVTGCTKISAGCDHCYIERTPPFRMAGRRFDKPGTGGTTGVVLHDDRLTLPLRWRKPRRIFVCSLADLFHDAVPARFIASVFATMVAAPQHTFQVLTKRHARLRALLTDGRFWQMVSAEIGRRTNTAPPPALTRVPDWIWIGVSVESQEWADRRIPALLDVPAAVRWLSCEPLLGPVDLSAHLDRMAYDGSEVRPDVGHVDWYGPAIRWVVAGGESGPGARLMEPAWARGLRDQCAAAGVAFFFKQWGEWAPNGWRGIGNFHGRERLVGPVLDDMGHREVIERVGKKAAGRELDGRTWDEYPTVTTEVPA